MTDAGLADFSEVVNGEERRDSWEELEERLASLASLISLVRDWETSWKLPMALQFFETL